MSAIDAELISTSICRHSSSQKHHLCCSSSGLVPSCTASRGCVGRPSARTIGVQRMPQVHHLRLRLLRPPNWRQGVRHMSFPQRSCHRIMHRRPRQVDRDKVAPCSTHKPCCHPHQNGTEALSRSPDKRGPGAACAAVRTKRGCQGSWEAHRCRGGHRTPTAAACGPAAPRSTRRGKSRRRASGGP